MEVSRPLVSIITPSYNQGRYIEETILSVLNQDYPNIEYIIIDGGSNDSTIDIIKKYENRINYWVSEQDDGQTHAILKGFRVAKGDFFCWLCSDDILEPSMVSLSVKFMLEKPEIGLTFGNRTRIDEKGNILGFSKYTYREIFFSFGLTLPQETVLFKRSAYEKTDGLDVSLHMAMDYDLWCKMSRITQFEHIPAFLGRFRTYANNKSAFFTTQLNNSEAGALSSEFLVVYKRHYKKDFSKKKFKLGKLFRTLLTFIDKRRSNYMIKLSLIRKTHYENITYTP